MSDYYDRQGEPLSLDEWMHLFENREYKIVEQTKLPGDVLVSTVWLGLDHSFTPGARPLIFETMIFGGELDEEQCRWETEENARQGHAMMLARAQAAIERADDG